MSASTKFVSMAASVRRDLDDTELDAVSGGNAIIVQPVVAPKETITFSYGSLVIQYAQQAPHGSF